MVPAGVFSPTAGAPPEGAAGYDRLRQRLFLAMVFLLPLHTVFLRAWVAWKPFLVLLVAVVSVDLWAWHRTGRWPWHRPASLALGVFLAALLLGFPGVEHGDGFLRLWLSVLVGGMVLLVTERSLRLNGMLERLLRVQFLSAATLATTGVVFTLTAVGAFGHSALAWVNDIPGVLRVTKAAYLEEGFVVLTNWHHEPGYGASWATLWAVLVLASSARGLASGRWWVDAVVLGGLAFGVVVAFSRTAWLVLPLAFLTATALLTWTRRARLRDLARQLLGATLVAGALLAVVWGVDPRDVDGDLDRQFAFRWHQGCELVGSFGLWWESEVGFEDAFDASEKRPEVWAWYLEAFLDHPLTGIGLGVGRDAIAFEPHNLFIQLLGESGAFGLLAFLLLLGVVIRQGRGVVGAVALAAAFMPLMTLTVLFEPTWWFAAGLLLGGHGQPPAPTGDPRTVAARPSSTASTGCRS